MCVLINFLMVIKRVGLSVEWKDNECLIFLIRAFMLNFPTHFIIEQICFVLRVSLKSYCMFLLILTTSEFLSPLVHGQVWTWWFLLVNVLLRRLKHVCVSHITATLCSSKLLIVTNHCFWVHKLLQVMTSEGGIKCSFGI